MSIEAKAKTPDQIIKEIDRPLKMKEKWVPLEEVQKREKALEQRYSELETVAFNYGARLDAANKILDEFERVTGKTGLIMRLRAVLEIPRLENEG
jgi:hypothetical protein